MKELIPLIQSYTRNSINIIKDLQKINIPKGAIIFSANAISMYTNIETETGLATIKDLLKEEADKISPHFPSDLFINILEIVMKNNVFTFGDTYWLQKSGTAMGTPAACAYATISFGHYENKHILTTFSDNFIYYKRYIDDVFDIWLPPAENNQSTWNTFKRALNGWGKLQWIIEEPSSQTVFLDLDITLKNSKILTKTVQKNMNLYLYIPPTSAHPPSCLKGLITGEMRQYWLQNNYNDFQNILSKFIERLIDRGHKLEDLIPVFQQASYTLSKTEQSNSTSVNANTDSNTLYIHWTYHPMGIKKRTIRQLYNETLANHLNYDKSIIAVSRPTNLRDILVRAATDTKMNDFLREVMSSP